MISLRKFHNFFDLDNDFDYFFRPLTLTNFIFDDSSDEELYNRRRYLRSSRYNTLRSKPKENSSTFIKSYFQKSTMNKDGKPETYLYENQIEDHMKDGHKYSKRVQNIKKNGKTKCITDKRIDNKTHRIISEKNEDGSNSQRNIVKGFKEQKMDDFDKIFDEHFNKIFNRKCKKFMEINDCHYPQLFLNENEETNEDEEMREEIKEEQKDEGIKEEQNDEGIKEEQKDEGIKEEQKDEGIKEEQKDEGIKEEQKDEEIKIEEQKDEEIKIEEQKDEEIKIEEQKDEEIKEEQKDEEIKIEEQKDEKIKEEQKKVEIQQDNDDIIIEDESNKENISPMKEEEEIDTSSKNHTESSNKNTFTSCDYDDILREKTI
jgi:hypothetical protein